MIKSIINFFGNIFNKLCLEGKYYKKIRLLEIENTKRKNPRTYYVFRFDEEDSKRNALFTSFEVGIKLHMMCRGYLNKIAGMLPPCPFQQLLYKLIGLRVEKNVFIAPEFITDVLVIGWTKIKEGCSIGLAVKCFNHLFEEHGRVLMGYITIGENTSIGGYTTITPGVTIGKNVSIGGGVVLGPGAKIEDNVKIKAASIIGSFVRIGEGSEVETGSVVIESVPPNMRVAGNPAKIISENPKFRKKSMTLSSK